VRGGSHSLSEAGPQKRRLDHFPSRKDLVEFGVGKKKKYLTQKKVEEPVMRCGFSAAESSQEVGKKFEHDSNGIPGARDRMGWKKIKRHE